MLFASCAPPAGPRHEWIYYPPPPDPPRVVHLLTFDSLSDLVPQRSSLAPWSRPAADVRIGAPLGVAYSGSQLYVCDTSAGCVHVWDLDQGIARRLGSGELRKPVAVAADCAGRICVADAARAQVLVFDTDERLVQTIALEQRSSWRPVALACAGARLYVADLGQQRIYSGGFEDGQVLAPFTPPGTAAGQLSHPCSLAVTPAGQVVVAELMSGRVHILESDAAPSGVIGSPGRGYGNLGRPRAVAVGPDGTVFIADAAFGCIHMFDLSGRLLMVIGPDGMTPLPNGICVARQVPARIRALVPTDFVPAYYLWVSNTVNTGGLVLFAVGEFESR